MSSGFSIEELKAQVSQSGGLAAANQFMIQLPQLRNFKVDARELNLMCTATALPGRQIMSMDYQIGTTMRKVANGYATTDLQLTFLVANNHVVRQYFEAWQAEAHDPVTKEVGYFEDYTKDVSISTVERGLRLSLYKKQIGFLNKVPSFIKNRLPNLGPVDLSQGEIDLGAGFDTKKTYTCKLRECYPTTITDQVLGNTQEGVMELSVQLSYTDWESEAGEFTGQGEAFGRGAVSTGAALLGKLLG